jgi:hypothetical protein
MPKFLTDEQMQALEASDEVAKPTKHVLSDDEMAALEAKHAEKPGHLEALARGATSGATLGFADEAAGALGALGDLVTGNAGFKELPNSYRDYRDAFRKGNDDAKAAHPSTYLTGELGGGVATLAIPGVNAAKGASLAAKIGTAAKVGAVAGLGNSDADLTRGDVGRAAADTGIGAGVGAATGALGEYLAGKADKVPGAIRGKAESLAETATGATAKQAEKFTPGAGRELLDRGIVKFGDTPGKIAERAESAMTKAGQGIDGVLSNLDAQGGKVARDHVLADLYGRLSQMGNDPSTAGVRRKLGKLIEDVAAGPKEMTLTEAEAIKRGFQGQSNYTKPLTTKATKTAANVYRQAVEDVATSMDPAASQAFQADKKVWGLLDPIREAAARRAEQLKQQPPAGLLDIASAVGGAAVGGPIGAVATPVARRFIAPRIASSAAVTLDNVGALLQKLAAAPNAQKYIAPLAEAAKRGGTSLAATHAILLRTDPEYRKLTEGSNE